MIITDGCNKLYRVVNMDTGHTKSYKDANSIARRFGCSRELIFHCIDHNLRIHTSCTDHNLRVHNAEFSIKNIIHPDTREANPLPTSDDYCVTT